MKRICNVTEDRILFQRCFNFLKTLVHTTTSHTHTHTTHHAPHTGSCSAPCYLIVSVSLTLLVLFFYLPIVCLILKLIEKGMNVLLLMFSLLFAFNFSLFSSLRLHFFLTFPSFKSVAVKREECVSRFFLSLSIYTIFTFIHCCIFFYF